MNKFPSCSDEQWEAITHDTGPALVIAGPGSGKTFVITHRLQYLISNLGISPTDILVITFTKAAALQMKERCESLLGKVLPINFGTFHSVFFKILCSAGAYNAGSILKASEKNRILRNIIEETEKTDGDINEIIQSFASDISKYKCTYSFDNKKKSQSLYLSSFNESFMQIYTKYTERLDELRKVDFDDMLIKTYKILKGNRHFAAEWQKKFRYILVDEFQDIDPLQFETLKLLTGDGKNIFAVGDDDQSIYSFRGSDPGIMLGFEKEFTNTHRILLDTNYRSSREIVNCAGNIISENKKRFAKCIKAFREGQNQEDYGVCSPLFEDSKEESRYIIEYIRSEEACRGANDGCVENGDIAILARTNSGLSYMAGKLTEAGIAYSMNERKSDIYSHFIAYDLRNYIKMAMGDMSRSSFLTIMNRPERNIGRGALKSERVDLEDVAEYYRMKNAATANNVLKMKQDLGNISKMKPYAAISYIYNIVGYKKYLKEREKELGEKKESFEHIYEEIKEKSKNCASLQAWLTMTDKRDEEKMQVKTAEDDGTKRVLLMTIHGSKGLEFNTVFVIDIADGIIPYKRSSTPEMIEEERRIFYVAVTRAKNKLYLCRIGKVRGKSVPQSRFMTNFGYLDDKGSDILQKVHI